MQVDQLTGNIIGRYRIGGRAEVLPYATIHRAQVLTDGRPVLLWAFASPYCEAAGFLEALQGIAGDRRAAGLPGLASVLEIGTWELPAPIVYLVSEDAGRGFLVGLLQAGRAPGVITTATAVGRALEQLHRRDLVHGDIQPAMVAVDSDGSPMLVGYGVRRVVARVNPSAEWLRMSGGFRPPGTNPTAAGSRADDLYGLAALTYYLLIGRPPAGGAATVPPGQARPQLPAQVDRAVMRALSTDPDSRYSSAEEFLDALRQRPAAPRSSPAQTPTSQPAPSESQLPSQERGSGRPDHSPAATDAAISTGPAVSTATSDRSGAYPMEPESPSRSLISLVPLEPYEMAPELRRRSGIVLLAALVVLALVLLVLSITGRLYL
jgi:serine/threonine protein kinase